MNVLSPSSLSKGERVSFPSRRPRAANRVRRRTQSLGLYLYLLGYASARTPMTHAPARHGADSGERSKQSRTRTAKRSQGRAGQGKSNRTEQRAGCQAQAARRVLSRVYLFVFLPNPANCRKQNFDRNFAKFR